jgi:hypothetical protein
MGDTSGICGAIRAGASPALLTEVAKISDAQVYDSYRLFPGYYFVKKQGAVPPESPQASLQLASTIRQSSSVKLAAAYKYSARASLMSALFCFIVILFTSIQALKPMISGNSLS